MSEAVAMAMLDDRQPVPEGEDHRYVIATNCCSLPIRSFA